MILQRHPEGVSVSPILHLANDALDFQLVADGSGTVRHASGDFHFGRVGAESVRIVETS
jgi:hypothetical protein